MLMRNLILKTSATKPVQWLVRKTFLFRPLVKRFIAGDTLEEALVPCQTEINHGIFVTLDYLGENTKSEAEALQAKAEYLRMLDSIAASPASKAPRNVQTPFGPLEATNISIKLTQCGLDQGTDFAIRNYLEVVERAKAHNSFVRVDMEASEYTQRTIDIVSQVFREHGSTGTVLQSYLHRTDDDVDHMIELGARVRLVKGAYLEPATVAFPEKSKVDEQYVQQAKRLLKAGHYPAIATHDEKIIKELQSFVETEKIDRASFEFQMLYGIRRDLQENLTQQGYNVRVYVPFGDAWYPYFTRRLAERPANAFFILKAMFKK